jgi:hypothetical protein
MRAGSRFVRGLIQTLRSIWNQCPGRGYRGQNIRAVTFRRKRHWMAVN